MTILCALPRANGGLDVWFECNCGHADEPVTFSHYMASGLTVATMKAMALEYHAEEYHL